MTDRAVPDAVDGTASDEALLQAAAVGAPDALGHLYDRYWHLMHSVAMRMVRDATLAEDVVQEAFLGIWRSAHSFDPARGSARTWMLIITHHRAIDCLRSRRATTELPGPELPVPAELQTPGPWRQVSLGLDAVRIRDAIRELSHVQREAVTLSYLMGLTHTQIAAQTRAPLGTVKSRVRLGLHAMRTAFDPEDTHPATD